jgi:four helix bundle protein
MNKIQKFEDLQIWNEGMDLVIEIYNGLKSCQDYGLRDQLQRAAVSIPSNIAEGFERQSNKEFIQYLFIAKGSCGELRTQIHIASRLRILSDAITEKLLEKTRKISAMTYKLIKTRREKF